MISVILCTFNRSSLLHNALLSLARQDNLDKNACEVLVVDNNSQDSTKECTQTVIEKYPEIFRYYYEPHQGKSFALNLALKNAKGDVFAFTDDDVEVPPDWIARIWKAFQNIAIDGVGGKILPKWETEQPYWFSKELYSNLALIDYGNESFLLDNDKPFYGANMAFRKIVFEKIGQFRTDLGRCGGILLGNEDTELYKRAFAAGFKMLYDPHVIVNHVIAEDRMKKKYFRKYNFRAGETIVLSGRDNATKCRNIFGIPLWRMKEYLVAFKKLIIQSLLLRRESAFMNEIKVCEGAGYIYGRVRQKSINLKGLKKKVYDYCNSKNIII